MKKQHPKYKFLFGTEEGKIYYESGKEVPTNKLGTRERFVVKRNNKCILRMKWDI